MRRRTPGPARLRYDAPMPRLRLAALALVLSACAGDEYAYGEPPALEIVNLAAYPLKQIYVHEQASYAGAPNRLAMPLARMARVRLDMQVGPVYVTAVRVHATDDYDIAFTTAYPIELQYGLYTLEVFDQEFRLRHSSGGSGGYPAPDAPRPPDAARRDAGRPDGGRPDAGRGDGAAPDGAAPDAASPDASGPDASTDAAVPDGGAPPDATPRRRRS